MHHHVHDLEHVHYDVRSHDNHRAHYHEWADNNHFATIDADDRDFYDHADDYQLTVGADHDHPGYDIRWPNVNGRTTVTPTASTTGPRRP